MKQITICDLLPLLRKGWVVMNKSGRWYWHQEKPYKYFESWESDYGIRVCLNDLFDIAYFDGDWKDSLMECGNDSTTKEKTSTDKRAV